jgi:hypothetical protein
VTSQNHQHAFLRRVFAAAVVVATAQLPAGISCMGSDGLDSAVHKADHLADSHCLILPSRQLDHARCGHIAPGSPCPSRSSISLDLGVTIVPLWVIIRLITASDTDLPRGGILMSTFMKMPLPSSFDTVVYVKHTSRRRWQQTATFQRTVCLRSTNFGKAKANVLPRSHISMFFLHPPDLLKIVKGRKEIFDKIFGEGIQLLILTMATPSLPRFSLSWTRS